MESGRDPILLLTPSDHGVLDAAAFRSSIRGAVAAVESGGHNVILFGAEPSNPDGDYGWISPAAAPRRGSEFMAVDSFVEKPPRETAARLFENRAVWNTMVIVARLSVVLDLFSRHLPQLRHAFAHAQELPAPDRAASLKRHYEGLTVADFCRDVLMHAAGLSVRVWPAAIGWSDLGTPDRLRRWMIAAGEREWTAHPRAQTEARDRTAPAMEMEAMS
jgi:mannose-1-phosphate guanylyltransferase